MASGRMGSAVVPANQSIKSYTNSSGGAVTVNFNGQALCTSKNSCLGVKVVNNCSFTPTSTSCICCSCIAMVDCFPACCPDQTIRFYPDPSTCVSKANVQIHSGQYYRGGTRTQYYPDAQVQTNTSIPRIYVFDSNGCVMLPVAENNGGCAVCEVGYTICDCTSGTNTNINSCTYGSIIGKRKTGWVFPDPDNICCPDPKANWVFGINLMTCCQWQGGFNVITSCCHCGRNTKFTWARTCCFNGLDPDCLLAFQFRSSCCAISGVNYSTENSHAGCDRSDGFCYCREYAPTLVSFDPYCGITWIVNLELDSSGFGCYQSTNINLYQDGSHRTSTSAQRGINGSFYASNDTVACCVQKDIVYGQYQPFFASDGIVIRQDHRCHSGFGTCRGVLFNIQGYGNCISRNMGEEMIQTCQANQRCCCCMACYVCTNSWEPSNPMVRWLMHDPEACKTYLFWGDCRQNWGGIYEVNMEQNFANANPASANFVTGPISNPVSDTGLFCCQVTNIGDLPTEMQYGHFNHVSRLGPCCYLALVNGCHLYRSENLYTWQYECDWRSTLGSGIDYIHFENSNTRCYLSTDNTYLCRSDNAFNTLDCTGVVEYCLSFNNYSNGGIVLSDNDSVYVNNYSNTPFTFQVWGYEDS